jgi:hypothetical protein
MGTDDPYQGCGCVNNNENSGDLSSRYGDATDFSKCNVDGVQTPCSLVMKLWNADIVEPCPDNECGPRVVKSNGESVLTQPFRARADGVSGFYLGDDSFGIMLQGDTDLDTGEETSDPMDFASFFVDGSKKKEKKGKGKSNKSKIRVKPAHPIGTGHAGVATPRPAPRPQPNDCLTFANLVANIAKKYENDPSDDVAQRFVYDLYKRFANSGKEFGSTGFKTQFVDPDPGSANQVRHYVGGLYVAFNVASSVPIILDGIALEIFNSREDRGYTYKRRDLNGNVETVFVPSTPSAMADTALNDVSFQHGKWLAGWFIPLRPKRLADKIRQDVCEKHAAIPVINR